MFCNKCGTKLKREYLFCPICGAATRIKLSRKSEKQMDELSEAVRQLKAGNEEGFSVIYFNTYKYVYNRARYMLNDEQEAQDLTQDVFVALYKGINELKDENALYGWLKTVVFRQGLKFIEKNKKAEVTSEDQEFLFDTLPDENVHIENSYGKGEDVKAIKRCIDKLSEDQRLVVLAYYYDNMGVREIADVLGISEGTVKSRLYLARKHLMAMLEEEEEKQGYKFFGAGLPMLMPALDKSLKANADIAKKKILAEYKAVCQQIEINETTALLKPVLISEKIVAEAATLGVNKILLALAGFLIVGVGCGTLLIAGNNVVENQQTAAEPTKTVKEVELAEVGEELTAENTDTSDQGAAAPASDSDDNGTSTTENEQDDTNRDTAENTENGTDDDNRENTAPVNLSSVGGLKYSKEPDSDDVNLSWSPVEGADGYEVYVATSESPTYKHDSTVTGTKTAIRAGGAYYHAKVRPYQIRDGKKVYGPFCSEISTEPDIVFPESIRISKVVQYGLWPEIYIDPITVNYHSEVILYRATAANGSYQVASRMTCSPGSTVTVTNLDDELENDDGQMYYYKVRIKAFKTWPGKSDKYSNYSNVFSYKYILDPYNEMEEEE